ncbi:MEDS domain-containing protein [Streptomyces lydicus]
MSYGDDEVRWEAVTAFVRLGPARGEKVLLPSPGVPADEVLARIDFPRRGTAAARERGQPAVSSMREVIPSDPEFTAARQTGRLHRETDRATAEGYSGLRGRGRHRLLRRPGGGAVPPPALTEGVAPW